MAAIADVEVDRHEDSNLTEVLMESILEGVRVLDLTDAKGLYCGRMMADLGADVVVVEPPCGNSARNMGPFYRDIADPEKSLFWFYMSLNKRGITLNIETEEGRDIFRKLAAKADFIIESFEPGYLDELGLGYSQLHRENARLIMTSITPFGQTGPRAHEKSTDITLQATGGLAYAHGDPDRAPVRLGGSPQTSYLGGLQGALGSLLAFYDRENYGLGQQVDVSMQEAVECATLTLPEFWDSMKVNVKRAGRARGIYRRNGEMLPQRVVYRCKDGYFHFFIGGGVQTGRVASSKAMIDAANAHGMLEELRTYDWRGYDASKVTLEEETRIEDLIESFTVTLTRNELMEESLKRGMILAPILTPWEFMQREQQKARGFWVDVDHPELGATIPYAGAPAKMSETPWRLKCRAPLIGEHNREVYCNELGMSDQDLIVLKSEGVI